MPRIVAALALFTLLSALPLMSENVDRPTDRVLHRYREALLRTETINQEQIVDWLAKMDQSGRFSDLDYTDDGAANWHPWQHTQRTRTLALALASGEHAGDQSAKIRRAVLTALDLFLEERYHASNWWYNEIGIPRNIRDTVVILGDEMGDQRRAGLLEIINQHRVRGTGANLMWSAEIALHYGCLTQQIDLVETASKRIRSTITIGNPEGIQADGSFLQHGARLQSFHYGLSFADVAVTLGWQLRDTPWAYSEEEAATLSHLLLEGMQWMARGRYTVPSTMDRKASRPGTLRIDLRPILRLWREVDSRRAADLATYLARLEGKAPPLTGFRHFPQADFSVHHRPGFSFFVKTVSDRTHLTELMNKENLLGAHLHTGDHYLLLEGDEYFNLMPVWDWGKLPGITLATGFADVVRKPFTGGLGDGRSGLVTMDLDRRRPQDDKDHDQLKVRRSWFFHDDLVLSLIGGWDVARLENQPWTVLDQSRLQGEVVILRDGEISKPLPTGDHRLTGVDGIIHGETAWLPLNAASIELRLGPATSSWHRINHGHSDAPVTKSLFLATMRHDAQPESGGFVAAPGAGINGARRLLEAPTWKILRNDATGQAVEFDDGSFMAAFFDGGAVKTTLGKLTTTAPCLVLWNGSELRLAEPSNSGKELTIEWQGRIHTVIPTPEGVVVPDADRS